MATDKQIEAAAPFVRQAIHMMLEYAITRQAPSDETITEIVDMYTRLAIEAAEKAGE